MFHLHVSLPVLLHPWFIYIHSRDATSTELPFPNILFRYANTQPEMRLVASLGTFLSMFYTEDGLVSNPVALTPISLVTEVVYIFPHEISHFLFVQERVCSNRLPVIE